MRTLITIGLLLLAATGPLAAGRVESALQAQRADAMANPTDPGTLNDLANLLVLTGETLEAESTYRRVIELAPDDAAARFNLALLLQQRRAIDDAMDEYRDLIDLHPDHAWGHYQLATLHVARGNRLRAVELFGRALILDPTLADPHVNPHIAINKLATWARLRAYQDPAAVTAPRRYADPGRIAGMLVPEPKRPRPAAAPAPAAAPIPAELVRPAPQPQLDDDATPDDAPPEAASSDGTKRRPAAAAPRVGGGKPAAKPGGKKKGGGKKKRPSAGDGSAAPVAGR